METLFRCLALCTWKRFRNCQCWRADGCTPARTPCKACPTGGCIQFSLQESHNKIIIHYPEMSLRRNTQDGKGREGNAEQVSPRWDTVSSSPPLPALFPVQDCSWPGERSSSCLERSQSLEQGRTKYWIIPFWKEMLSLLFSIEVSKKLRLWPQQRSACGLWSPMC